MNCEQTRETLSAWADSEQAAASGAGVEPHLAGCRECRSWLVAAERLNRRIRVRPAATVPDLTARILAAADRAPAAGLPPRRSARVLRWSLAGVALAQFGVVLVDQFGGHHASDGAHLFNEGTAWNTALGIGFGVAARHPRLAAGLLPTLTAFVALLTAFAVADLAAGRAEALREGAHLLVVAGLVLLWLVAREDRRPRESARPPADGPADRIDLGDLVDPPPVTPDTVLRPPARPRRGLRPAGRRVA